MGFEKGDRVRLWVEIPGQPGSDHWETGVVEKSSQGWVEVITDNGGFVSGPQSNFEPAAKSGGQ